MKGVKGSVGTPGSYAFILPRMRIKEPRAKTYRELAAEKQGKRPAKKGYRVRLTNDQMIEILNTRMHHTKENIHLLAARYGVSPRFIKKILYGDDPRCNKLICVMK